MNSAVGKAKRFLKLGLGGVESEIIDGLLKEIDHLRTQDTNIRGRLRKAKEIIENLIRGCYLPGHPVDALVDAKEFLEEDKENFT